ncbi:MAG: LamB/YcsF family protein [Proteobacteria bacterium]|nr:LamB/YcsF family protein [Pseudomonadota bacterium]
MQPCIDFNCDLGEGCDDAAVLPYITSANIACGGHAGDAESMRRTVALCLQHGVAIGAHPSFEDREHFGRRELPLVPEAARELVLRQVSALMEVAATQGTRLTHVKPHGALYNKAARDRSIADAIAQAVRDFNPTLILVGLSGSALPAAGAAIGLRVAHEVFAERRYEADGSLTSRSHSDAVIHDLDASLAQVRSFVREGAVTTRTGERIHLRADTLCLHGDRPDAAAFARALRALLDAQGVAVHALGA